MERNINFSLSADGSKVSRALRALAQDVHNLRTEQDSLSASSNTNTNANNQQASSAAKLVNNIQGLAVAHNNNAKATANDTSSLQANNGVQASAAKNAESLASTYTRLAQVRERSASATKQETAAESSGNGVRDRAVSSLNDKLVKMARLIETQNSYSGTLAAVTKAEERAQLARRSHIRAITDQANAEAALQRTETAYAKAANDSATTQQRMQQLNLQREKSLSRVAEAQGRVIATAAREEKAMKTLAGEVKASESAFARFRSAGQGLGSVFGGASEGARTFLGVIGQFAGLSIIPMLAQMVPLIGSLGGGFIALTSAIGPAIGLLGALPGVLAGVATAASVIKFSFGGVSQALKAYDTQQAKSAQTGKANAEAARQQARAVKNAREALSKARSTAASNDAKAAQRVKDAEENAAEGIKKAYRALSDARRDAAERNAEANQKVVDAQRKAAEDNIKATERVSEVVAKAAEDDAKAAKDVANAREQAARQIQAAQREVGDAEGNLAEAQVRAKRAQDDLSNARKDAIQYLKDMQKSVRDASFSEEEATLSLERARERLAKTNSDPKASGLDRRQADLDYREAQARLADAQDAKRKAASDNAEAQKKGVEGSDIMVSAQQRAAAAAQDVVAAQQKLVESQRSLATAQTEAAERISEALAKQAKAHRDGQKDIADAEAERIRTQQEGTRSIVAAQADRAKAQRDGARSIADAEEALAKTQKDSARSVADAKAAQAETMANGNDSIRKAQDALNEALRKQDFGAAKAGVDAYKQAMDKLTPSQRKFTEFLIANRDKLDSLKEAASKSFLPILAQAMRNVFPLMPIFTNAVSGMGASLGKFVLNISTALKTSKNMSAIDRIFRSNNKAVDNAAKGSAGYTNALIRIADAARPVVEWIGNLVGRFGNYLDRVTKTNTENNKMAKFFERTISVSSQLGRIIQNLAGAFFGIGKAASDTGQSMLDQFEKWTKKLDDVNNSTQGQGNLKEWFGEVKEQLDHVWPVLQKIGTALKNLTVSEGFKKFMDALSKDGGGIDSIEKMFEALNNSDISSAGVDVISNLATVMKNLLGGDGSKGPGVLETYAKAIVALSDGLAALSNNKAGIWVLQAAVAAMAVTKVAKGVKGAADATGVRQTYQYVKKKRTDRQVKKEARTQAADASEEVVTRSSGTNKKKASANSIADAKPQPTARPISQRVTYRGNSYRVGGEPVKYSPVATSTRKPPIFNTNTTARVSGPRARSVVPNSARSVKVSRDTGSDVVSGFKQGVNSGISSVGTTANNLSNAFIERVKKNFEIKSPSRLMARLGSYVGQGFVNGIASENDDAKRAAENLENQVSSTLKSVDASIATAGKNAADSYVKGFNSSTAKASNPVDSVDAASSSIAVRSAAGDDEDSGKKKKKGRVKGARRARAGNAAGTVADIAGQASGIAALLGPLAMLAPLLDLAALGMGLFSTAAAAAAPAETAAATAGTALATSTEAVAVAETAALWPILLIIAAIAAIVAAMVLLYKKNETFRNFVNEAWDSIKNAIAGAWNNWIKPAFGAIKDFISNQLIPAMTWLWKNVVIPAWNGISTAISWAWNNVIKPVFGWLKGFITDTLVPAFTKLWGWVKNVFSWIGSAIKWAWDKVIKPVFKLLWEGIKLQWEGYKTLWGWVKKIWRWISDAIKWAWDNIIKPVFDRMKNGVKNLWEKFQALWNIIKGVWDSIKKKISDAWTAISGTFSKITGYLGSTFKKAWQNVWTRIRGVWDSVTGKISDAWDSIKKTLGKLTSYLGTTFKKAWEDARDMVGRVWDGIKGKVAAPIKWVWSNVIGYGKNPKGLTGGFNKLAGMIGAESLKINLPWIGLATGGRVPGSSPHARADNIPAMLTAGEWVQPVDSVQHYGPQFMEAIRTKKLPKSVVENWASGGEAGSDERKKKKRQRFSEDGDSWYAHLKDGGAVAAPSAAKSAALSLPKVAPKPIAPDADGVTRLSQGGGAGGGSSTATPPPKSGMSWQWQWNQVQNQFPDVRLSSAYRPGARTRGYGNMSYHAIGRAIDIAGAPISRLKQVATWIRNKFGAVSHDLLYSHLWGNKGYYRGSLTNQSAETVADHWSHVHWGLATGSESRDILMGKVRGVGGGAGDFLMSIADKLGGAPLALLKKAYSGLLSKIPGAGSNLGKTLAHIPDYIVGKMADRITSWWDDNGGGSDGSSPDLSVSGNIKGAVNIGKAMAEKMGWTGGQWDALYKLWMKESRWNPRADNPTSDAYGIPQALPGSKMASAGKDWRTNPQTQIKWGLGYIKQRYGSPAEAWRHSQRTNWYAEGGPVAGHGNTDSVKAMLMPGEFVVRKEAVKRIGTANLHALNNIDRPGRGSYGRGGSSKTQRFATGGMVAPTGPINGIKPGTRGFGMKFLRTLFRLPVNGAGFGQHVAQDGWFNDLTAAYKKNNFTVPSLPLSISKTPQLDSNKIISWLGSFTSKMTSAVLKSTGRGRSKSSIITTREMQKIVGTGVDGVIGKKTLTALRKYKSTHGLRSNKRNEWDYATQRFMSMDNFPDRWRGNKPRAWSLANFTKRSMFEVARWAEGAPKAMKRITSTIPKAVRGNLEWDFKNMNGKVLESFIKSFQRLAGMPQTGKWDSSASEQDYTNSDDTQTNDLGTSIKYILDKGLKRETASVFPPWWELSPVQQAIENSDKGNKNMAEFLKSLDTLSSWGLGYLVEELQSQGAASGLPLAKSAVASRKLAEQHNEQLRRTKELEATGTEDYTKFVSTVLAPGPQLGIRKIAQAVGVADFAVVDMWKKLLKAGRLKAGSERTAALERDVRLFDRGVFYANTGGKVPGYGDSDTVPAMLTPGEFVLKKAAVKAIGLDNLYKMNGDTQYFANGGMVYNMNAVASRASVSDLGMVASNMKSNVSARPIVENKTIVNNNTTINNPVREPSTKSMNKMLRQRATLGGSTVGTDTVNGEM